MNRITKSSIAVAIVASIGAILAPVGGTPAEAAVTGYQATTTYIGGGATVNVRVATSLTSRIAYTLSSGSSLSIDCQVVGGRLGFSQYADNRTWDRLSSGNYVHDVVTTTPGGPRMTLPDGGYVAYSSNIPKCGAPVSAPPATRETRAVDFARSQLGVSNTNLTPDGMWSGWCELLAEQAYGTRSRYGSALADYNAQRAAGRIHTDTNPPAGALVFYQWGTYGHVGISLGGGQVISTKGFSTPEPVRQHAVVGIGSTGLPYLGWSYAPSTWAGR